MPFDWMGSLMGSLTGIFLLLLLAWLGIASFKYLWNSTMPQVFGLREITFWQAFRLLFIASALTSGGFIRFTLPQ